MRGWNMAVAAVVLWLCVVSVMASDAAGVECWDVFEVSLKGPSSGNPFVDVDLSARFRQGDRVFTAEGFYDGTRSASCPMRRGGGRTLPRATARSWTARGARSPAPRPDRTITGPCGSTTRSAWPTPTGRRTSPSAPPATPGRTRATRWKSRRFGP